MIQIHIFQYADMTNYAPTFRENFHMSEQQFDYILEKIKKHLEPARHVRRDIISPRAKLSMVLE